jgi:two-component system response regulator RegX3
VESPYAAMTLAEAFHPTLRVLLVLPHLQQATALARALLSLRLLPTLAFTAGDVNAYLEIDSFAVLVLHLGKPDAGCLVAGVRRRSRAPILALGAERQPVERIWSLRCEGYAPDTLPPAALARRALELIFPPQPPSRHALSAWQVHTWGPLRLDPSRRLACWHGQPISLTSMQFRLLLVLVQAEGAVVSPVELSRRVWGTDLAHDNGRVVAHVRRIRKQLEADPTHPQFLLTVRGEGFRLADHDADLTAIRYPPPAVPLPAMPPSAVPPLEVQPSRPAWRHSGVERVTSQAAGPISHGGAPVVTG